MLGPDGSVTNSDGDNTHHIFAIMFVFYEQYQNLSFTLTLKNA